MLQKTFGKKEQGIHYRERVGAYAILFDAKQRIATVKLPAGYFLPGGGIEANETHEMCIVRECLEEICFLVEVQTCIGKGDLYGWSYGFQAYLHSTGYFYTATIQEEKRISLAPEHELVWLSPEECESELFLQHQAWAVREAIKQQK